MSLTGSCAPLVPAPRKSKPPREFSSGASTCPASGVSLVMSIREAIPLVVSGRLWAGLELFPEGETRNGAPLGTPLDCRGPFSSGGGGNRTLVRECFQNHPYVRRRISLRRPGPAMRQPSRALSPEVSRAPSGRRRTPVRLCDPMRAPRTGSRHRWCVKRA
jgi:hypothetical protein